MQAVLPRTRQCALAAPEHRSMSCTECLIDGGAGDGPRITSRPTRTVNGFLVGVKGGSGPHFRAAQLVEKPTDHGRRQSPTCAYNRSNRSELPETVSACVLMPLRTGGTPHFIVSVPFRAWSAINFANTAAVCGQTAPGSGVSSLITDVMICMRCVGLLAAVSIVPGSDWMDTKPVVPLCTCFTGCFGCVDVLLQANRALCSRTCCSSTAVSRLVRCHHVDCTGSETVTQRSMLRRRTPEDTTNESQSSIDVRALPLPLLSPGAPPRFPADVQLEPCWPRSLLFVCEGGSTISWAHRGSICVCSVTLHPAAAAPAVVIRTPGSLSGAF